MPYLFTTPHTSGHGSFRAAVGAIVAELEPTVHYFHLERDLLGSHLTTYLWLLVANQETSGDIPQRITFARADAPDGPEEFAIEKRPDVRVVIVTEDEVIEKGSTYVAVSPPKPLPVRRVLEDAS